MTPRLTSPGAEGPTHSFPRAQDLVQGVRVTQTRMQEILLLLHRRLFWKPGGSQVGPPFSLQSQGSATLYCLPHQEVWLLNGGSAPPPAGGTAKAIGGGRGWGCEGPGSRGGSFLFRLENEGGRGHISPRKRPESWAGAEKGPAVSAGRSGWLLPRPLELKEAPMEGKFVPGAAAQLSLP